MNEVETVWQRLRLILAVTVVAIALSMAIARVAMHDDYDGRTLFMSVLVPLLTAPPIMVWVTGIMRRNTVLTRKLAHMVRHDQMTGLLTRGAFFDQLSGPSGTFLMLDLDFFKSINDTHGHAAGDAVIRETAARIAETPGSGVTSARFGGEEFVLFLPGRTGPEARDLAEDLRRRIRGTPVIHEGAKLSVTASIGLAERTAGEPVDSVLRRADAALYEAKSQGRDRVVAASEMPRLGVSEPRPSSCLRKTDRRTGSGAVPAPGRSPGLGPH